MGSWDSTIEEWLISEGKCYAGMLAQFEDGMPYAAAPVENEAGWGFVYKEDHEEDITQDDGSTKKMTINEPGCLKEACESGKTKPGGFWLGGLKYNITQYDAAYEAGDYTHTVLFCNRPKKGVHVIKTASQIVCGFYDEEKGQTSGNAKMAVMAFAEYLAGL